MSGKTFREQIDDYTDTIFAIIGFVNLFRYDDDTKSFKTDVKIFQGRRMKTSPSNKLSPNNEVTPDFCLYDSTNKGVVGEVKNSFPQNDSLWMDDFQQLMRYDDNLANWTTDSGTIDDHDIVLLTHYSRSRQVKRYFEQHKDKEISFIKNFIIVEFTRIDQASSFYSFRKEYGDLEYFRKIDERLINGIPVPLQVLGDIYKIELYDSKPPLPYLLHLIWKNIITLQASVNDKFAKLRKNSKLSINTTIDVIIEELHENYSFKQLNADNDLNQPMVPLKSWIKEAIDALVVFNLAEWKDSIKGECVLYFKKVDDPLGMFVDLCSEHSHRLGIEANGKQLTLF